MKGVLRFRGVRRRTLGLFIALCTGFIPAGVCEDALSQLPEQWKNRLQQIPEADLTGAEPYARETIHETRAGLARLLSAELADSREIAEGYGSLGALYQIYGLASSAQTGYSNAMALDPENFRWVYYAGYLAAQSGQHEEAVGLFQGAARLNPEYPALGLRLGESLLELSRIDAASELLRAAAEKPGLRARALYHLAQIDLFRRRYDEAIEKLEELLRLDPNADQAHYPLARALRAKNDIEGSAQHMAARGNRLPDVDDPMIKELQSLNQGARRFFSEGLRASLQQDFSAAAAGFRHGLEIEPENSSARVSLARALYLSGEAEPAATQLEQVLAKEPEHSLARFLLGVLAADANRLDQAEENFKVVLKREPNHFGAHFCLATLRFNAADFDIAADHYRLALLANPDIPPARLFLLLALKLSGVSDSEIVGQLESLYAAHPEQQILRYRLIRLLTLSDNPAVRQPERARGLVNELVQEAFIPPHVELQALVAAAVGNFEQAAALQRQVLPVSIWMGDDVYRRAEAALAAYQRSEMPDVTWYREESMLQPPKIDAQLLFREYPTPVPY